LALAGECRDEVLSSVYIEAVVPAPDASRLLVRLVVPARANASIPEVLERIELVRGLLRAEVAQAITRKRAPELTFLPVAETGVSP
jgi:ribosome-binding factor A